MAAGRAFFLTVNELFVKLPTVLHVRGKSAASPSGACSISAWGWRPPRSHHHAAPEHMFWAPAGHLLYGHSYPTDVMLAEPGCSLPRGGRGRNRAIILWDVARARESCTAWSFATYPGNRPHRFPEVCLYRAAASGPRGPTAALLRNAVRGKTPRKKAGKAGIPLVRTLSTHFSMFARLSRSHGTGFVLGPPGSDGADLGTPLLNEAMGGEAMRRPFEKQGRLVPPPTS